MDSATKAGLEPRPAPPNGAATANGRRRTTVALVALLLALFAVPLWAQPAGMPEGLALYASFDEGLDADFARGEAAGTAEGNPEFTAGRSGRALVVGDLDGSTGVLYQTDGNFSFERGTVSMWVQPVNWRGDEPGNRLFFNTKPEGGGLFTFYKYTSTAWGLTLLTDPGLGNRSKTYIHSKIDAWEPGRWHHIACTWGRYESISLYVDGELVETLAGSGLIDGLPQETMRFGGDWHSEGGRTLIDEAMIFDRMLAPHEIASLAGLDAEAPAIGEREDVPGMMLAHSYLDRAVVTRVYADALGDPIADTARLTVTPVDGEEPAAEVSERLDRDEINQFTLDLDPLELGHYMARVELIADQTVIAVEALEISHETDFTWTQAGALGRRDTVLEPFDALEVDGRTITCAERTYAFGDGGLLHSAIAGGEELLAGPVRLIAETGGEAIEITDGSLGINRLAETGAVGTGTLLGPGLSVTSKLNARYDGTLWTELGVLANRQTPLSGLRIEVPLRPEAAEYLAWWAPRWVDDRRWGYGAMPEGEGEVWSREFMPSLWVGDEERGMGWFAESDQDWDLAEAGMLTIERRNDSVVLVMNVIREERTLTEPLKVAFGLQATPVRELADDWRANQWVPSSDISRFFLELRERPFDERGLGDEQPRGKVCYLYTHHKHFTNTLPRDPEEFREMIERAKSFGLYTTPYTEARFLPEDRGDYLLHAEEMPIIPYVRASGYGPHTAVGCCMKGPFSDWLVWYCRHMIDEYGTNGVYFDELQPMPCMNEAHGCGYVGADGERRPTYPMRAFLETMRRVRQVFEDTGEPYWITYHISAGRTAPMPTYGDCLLMAEERYHMVRENPDYTENTTPDEWLASFAPEAWGIPPVVIPQFKMSGEWMKDPVLADALMAAVVPHDLMVWPIFSHTETIVGYRSRLMEFGIDEPDTRFAGYWEADAPAQCADERVKCSAYIRPEKAMLCLGNWSDEAIAGLPVTVDLEAMRLPAEVSARNAMTGESVQVEGGIISVDLEPKRLALVEIR